MGIFSALFSGVNGINSNGSVVSVIGDNIANVNTVGYKASRASFEDILAGSESNVGLGSRISSVDPLFGQGGFESSSSVTDMAIDGNGFFMVENATDSSAFYSRAGQFHINKDGFIVNANDERLQGYQVTSGAITSNVDSLVVSQAPVQPSSSSTISVDANLNSNSTAPAAFSAANPTGTSNFSAGVTVYDSLGNSHLVTIYFRKTATNEWQWYSLANGAEVTNPTSGVNYVGGSGTLSFNNSGALTSGSTSAAFTFLGAASQTLTFDFGTGTAASGTGLDGVTQFGSSSAISNISQNGYASGSLLSIDVSSSGTITGNYSNGTTQTLGQVAIATFSDQQQLRRVGNNNFQETLNSGSPLIGAPGSSGKGTIVSSTLEQSNVDLANELIRMVIIQRGFQANSRTIATVNDLLAQLVTLGQG
ncbi:MAG: flagellar hook protein FlgE [Deltaproteobacteria bacterium]|nr:flagellar hook protein FlgE [Deltaproteobacteria bacterium]